MSLPKTVPKTVTILNSGFAEGNELGGKFKQIAKTLFPNGRTAADIDLIYAKVKAKLDREVEVCRQVRARVSLTLRLICGYLLRSLLPFLTCIYWILKYTKLGSKCADRCAGDSDAFLMRL